MDLTGKRVLVVGASVSLGATLAKALAEKGASVVISGRRGSLLDEVAESVPDKIYPIPGDITHADECQRLITETVGALGGLDWLIYAPALFQLRELDEITADEWQNLFAVNVIGAALCTKHALSHMAAGGRVLYFSSQSTPAHPHWAGLGGYAITKTALTKMAQVWQDERPEIGFTIAQLGPTEGSDGVNQGGWTPEQMAHFIPRWPPGAAASTQPRETVVQHILNVLASPSHIGHFTISPSPSQ